MLLTEFFNYNNNEDSMQNDRRYDNSRDSSVLKKSDTRKIRLTLRQINQLRMQSEAHDAEVESEVDFIRQMYATPVEAETPQ